MTPKTKAQYREIREGKKVLIMNTALELFANEGFHNTSISKIAKTAGISKGLMYNYFESKEALIREIVLKGFNNIIQIFDPNKDGFLTDNEFDFFINELFKIFEENRQFWKFYFSLVTQPSVIQLVYDTLMQQINTVVKTLSDYFERKGSKDAMTDALFFSATLDGIFFNYINNPDLFSLDKLRKKTMQLFQCYISKENINK